ncbi:MAG: hypothetical protein KGJ41_02265 [Rhodospirillales bacterium]|nr:hypothetical protein [Rhodospirillales bacterium]MDE2197820.1 hypothetical protein [Rhodospirillales bacterium]MDE2575899.1 hypothetical protein [Rhodospirillales bacterium]
MNMIFPVSLRAAMAGAVILLPLALGGCDTIDPFKRPGMWRPDDANAFNLQAQVADPHDLVMGRGTDMADGDTAAKAIERMRADKVKPLAANSIVKMGTN